MLSPSPKTSPSILNRPSVHSKIMAPLKIAISGGGIASLCLAHCLTSKHPQWEVKIFEAAPELREEGAAIGLGMNAQEALKLMSPSLRESLDDAGGTRMDPSVRIMIVNELETWPWCGLLDQC